MTRHRWTIKSARFEACSKFAICIRETDDCEAAPLEVAISDEDRAYQLSLLWYELPKNAVGVVFECDLHEAAFPAKHEDSRAENVTTLERKALYYRRPHLAVLRHELVADLVEHPPRGLVANAQLALKLLRGDPAPSASHEVHRVEPQVKGRGRFLEDRSGRWVDVVAAAGTRPRLATGRALVALERSVLVALGAMRRLAVRGEAGAPKPLKTGGVIGVLAHELDQGVARFRGCSADRLEAVNGGHLALLVVKSASPVAAGGALAFRLPKPNLSSRVGQRLYRQGPIPLASIRAFLQRLGWNDRQIDKALRRQEHARQERVRRSLASHGPWGGER